MQKPPTCRRLVAVAALVLPVSAGLTACSRTEPLQPRTYVSPLTQLQRLEGKTNHLHTEEVRYRPADERLFLCGYFEFQVIDARDPAHMRYLAEGLSHTIPNDQRKPGCVNLAYDGNIVYTTHRGNIDNPAFLSGWDLSRTDPENPEAVAPVQLPVVQEPDVSY